ncbi:MAG: hypothetical protein AAF573_10410 [Bacteroidota bacterium]
MKQLTFLSRFFILSLALTFWTSCGEDGTGGVDGITLPPTVELQAGVDLVTTATTIDASSTFKVNVRAESGDNTMTTFTVLEDGIAIDASRLKYNDEAFGNFTNPYTLSTAEQSVFDTNIEIIAHDEGTKTYTFRIADSASETDETTVDISVNSTPLSFAFDASNGGLSTDATLPDPTSFKVQLVATKGSSPLSTLAVLEDGVEVDASRVKFGTDDNFSSAASFPSNPLDLINDEKDGFNWFIWVSSHDSGTRTYTFRLTAENSDTEDLSLAITIFSGTPVVELTGKLLLNSGGPQGQGGINLLTGDGDINSTDSDAHLRDVGIDLSLPSDQNWIRKIAPANGSILKTPGIDFPVDDFSAIQFSEEIQTAYDNGNEISESDVVNIGDRFLVGLATGQSILVLVTNVTETTNNNADSYEFAIKY